MIAERELNGGLQGLEGLAGIVTSATPPGYPVDPDGGLITFSAVVALARVTGAHHAAASLPTARSASSAGWSVCRRPT